MDFTLLTQINPVGEVTEREYVEAFESKSQARFAEILAENVEIVGSYIAETIVGVEQASYTLAVESQNFIYCKFTDQANDENRTWLEWDVITVHGMRMEGVTILTRNGAGKIEKIAIHARSLGELLAFSVAMRHATKNVLSASHWYTDDLYNRMIDKYKTNHANLTLPENPLEKYGGNRAEGVDEAGWANAFASQDFKKFVELYDPNAVHFAAARGIPGCTPQAAAISTSTASQYYEYCNFVHQAQKGNRTWLEWDLLTRDGMNMQGCTLLTRNDDGKIVMSCIHHRPLGDLLLFSEHLREYAQPLFGAEEYNYLTPNLCKCMCAKYGIPYED